MIYGELAYIALALLWWLFWTQGGLYVAALVVLACLPVCVGITGVRSNRCTGYRQ